ncbi:MAG: hypothetical protein ACXWRE_14350 [Pseudobdellovibrionaceae bacterium]
MKVSLKSVFLSAVLSLGTVFSSSARATVSNIYCSNPSVLNISSAGFSNKGDDKYHLTINMTINNLSYYKNLSLQLTPNSQRDFLQPANGITDALQMGHGVIYNGNINGYDQVTAVTMYVGPNPTYRPVVYLVMNNIEYTCAFDISQ